MNELIIALIPLLCQIESGGDPNAMGDYRQGVPQAVGCLQIWPCVVQDVNRIGKAKYTMADRLDPVKSKEMARIYLEYWGKHYQKQTGKKPTMEVLSRVWNSGPNGYKKDCSKPYWKKVKELMK